MVVEAEVEARTTKTTLRSERRSTHKKYLTGPTLLEMSGKAYRELTDGLELSCGASTVRTFSQKLVERYRRNQAELDQIVLELAREEERRHRSPFYNRSQETIQSLDNILFCVFGFFVAFAAWVCFKELVIPFFR